MAKRLEERIDLEKGGLGIDLWGWAQSVILGSHVNAHQRTSIMKEAINNQIGS